MIGVKKSKEEIIITKEMVDYINLCFIDFSDDCRYKYSSSTSIMHIYIDVDDELTLTYSEHSIKGHRKVYNWRLKQLEEVESCLNKIKLLYSDIFYYIEFTEYTNDHGFMNKGNGRIYLVLSKYRSSLKQIKL